MFLVQYIVVVCDKHCSGGCVVQGTGKCDSTCMTGHTLNSTVYVCSPGTSLRVSYSHTYCIVLSQ